MTEAEDTYDLIRLLLDDLSNGSNASIETAKGSREMKMTEAEYVPVGKREARERFEAIRDRIRREERADREAEQREPRDEAYDAAFALRSQNARLVAEGLGSIADLGGAKESDKDHASAILQSRRDAAAAAIALLLAEELTPSVADLVARALVFRIAKGEVPHVQMRGV